MSEPATPRGGARLALVVAWIAMLALLGLWTQSRLVVGTDLRLFMPTPQTPAQHLLLEEIGEGPGSRLLLLAIEGGSESGRVDTSRALVEALRDDPAFRFVANGETGADAIPETLLAYRYLLSPTLDTQRFDEAFLRRALELRVQDLSSPASGLVEPWLARDPTLEVLELAQRWQPANEPQKIDDVWFDAKGERALLVAETAAVGFDPDAQRAALDRVGQAFAEAKSGDGLRLVASGPGAFAVRIKESTQGEATMLGAFATGGMLILLLLAYRSPRAVALGALPLASAALAGLAAVSTVFGTVHGITLAFGATLIGVAQDYPMHLLSHQHAGVTPRDNARSLWPTLATGVASTCIAYLAFLFSGVRGLAQLACFTIAGLAVAGLTTRYLLPHLIDRAPRDPASLPWTSRLQRLMDRLPRARWLVPLLVIAGIAALFVARGPLWENNLAALTPLPADAVALDTELRSELGAPDTRYLLVVRDATPDGVLAREERLVESLDALVAQGAIAGYDAAARYLPSAMTQQRRQAALPDAASLRSSFAAAIADAPFDAALFEPFHADVERARTLPPLTIEAVAETPLAPRIEGLLLRRDDASIGLVSLTGVTSPAAIAEFAGREGIEFLDLKDAAESLVVEYRERILWSLAVAAALLAIVVFVALRDPRRAARVLLPMAVTTLVIVAALHVAGVPLSLFHLIALVLAAGLGLDYALFFEHAGDDAADHRRTLHALVVCSLSTLMVFALLATSSLPVLRAIGLTVSIGVVSNFLLAALVTRRSAHVAA